MALAVALSSSLFLALAAMSWAIVSARFFVGGLLLIASQALWLFVASQLFGRPMVELMIAIGVWFFVGSVLMMAGAVLGLCRRLLGER